MGRQLASLGFVVGRQWLWRRMLSLCTPKVLLASTVVAQAVDPLELMDPFDHRNNLGSQCFGMLPLGAELAAAFKRVQNVQLYQVWMIPLFL